MATPPDEQEINRIIAERLGLQREGYSLSTAYLESLKEALGIQSRLNQFENDTLDINKKIQKAIRDQNVELEFGSDKIKQINKNEEILRKAKLTLKGLESSLTSERNKQVDKTIRAVQLQNSLTKEIEEELKKAEQGLSVDQSLLTSKKAQLAAVEREVDRRVGLLNPLEKQLLYTKLTSAELEKQNNARKKELGTLGKIVGHLEGLPVIGNTMKSISTFMAGGLAGLAVAALFIGKAIAQADEKTTGLQKSFGINRNIARGISLEFERQSIVSGDIFITSKKLNQSFRDLSAELGFAADISGQTLETFTNLTKRLGLGNKEAAQLTYLARLQGENTEDTLQNVSKTVSQLNKEKSTAINIKDVFNDISSASAATVVSLGGSVDELAKASIKARQLGLNLSQVDQVAASLLDFQTSIENELAAELMTGKQLNLEAARYYALTNQTEKLTDEIANNQEIINAFASDNRLAQEASAKALGLSREDLGKMVMQQQFLALGADAFRAKFGEANYEQMKSLSIGEKFKATLEKVQEIVGNIGYALEPVFNILSSITSNAGVLYTILGTIALVTLPKMIMGFGRSILLLGQMVGLSRAKAIAELSAASAATLGLATLGIIAGIAAGAAAITSLTKADDLYSGHGKRILLAPEGAFALNDRDNIIATTNPIPANDIVSRPAGSVRVPTQQAQTKTQQDVKVMPSTTVVQLNLNNASVGNAVARNTYRVSSNIKSFGGRNIDNSSTT